LFSCSDKRFKGIAKKDNYYPLKETYPPKYRLYTANDSATLFFKIPATGVFRNNRIEETITKLKVAMYDDFTKRNLIDSLSIDVVAKGDQINVRQMVEGSIELGGGSFGKNPVVMEIFSEQNIQMPTNLMYIDSLYDDPSRYLLMDQKKKVRYENYITSGDKAVVFSDFFDDKDVKVETYVQSDRLPKPPFSNFVPGPSTIQPEDTKTVKADKGYVEIDVPDSTLILVKWFI